MNKLIFSTLFFLLTCLTMAKNEILLDGEIESGGYGGPMCKIGKINNKTGVYFGGQGGWIINHSIVLGGKGYVLVNPIDIIGLQNISVGFACGGVLMEYIFESYKLLHFNIECMIGVGVVYNDVKNYSQPHTPIDYTDDIGFVLEPGFNFNLNVIKFFRIAVGVTYSYLSGIDYNAGASYRDLSQDNYENISDADLKGLSVQIVLKFGEF